MAIQSKLEVRPPSAAPVGNPLVQAGSLDQGANGDAAKDRSRSSAQERSVLEQLLHNLMLTLGAPWPA